MEHYSYEADHSENILGYAPIAGTDGWSIAVNIDEDEFMRPAFLVISFKLSPVYWPALL